MDSGEFNERIERLRFANRWSWEELARALGLSRVMLFHLRKGTHSASEKTLRRLAELDRKSGVGADARQWIQAISERAHEQRIRVSRGDVARGFLEAELEYLVRAKPAEFPVKVRLTRPAVRDAARLLVNLMLDEDFDSILYKTLPTKLANERFLNALSPFCYRELANAAMDLVFGLEWKKRLPQLPVKRGTKS
jgi:transcriptional regulator with XRE-family HTH domain